MLECWNNGPPWRDKNVTELLYCIVSGTEALALKPSKSGLGQGTMGFGKMGHGFIGKIPLDMGVRNIKIEEISFENQSFHYSMYEAET